MFYSHFKTLFFLFFMKKKSHVKISQPLSVIEWWKHISKEITDPLINKPGVKSLKRLDKETFKSEAMKSTSPMQYVIILDKIHIILYLKANCLSKYFFMLNWVYFGKLLPNHDTFSPPPPFKKKKKNSSCAGTLHADWLNILLPKSTRLHFWNLEFKLKNNYAV